MKITRMKTFPEAHDVASIHAAEIEGSFLTELGRPFLNLLYEAILEDKLSVCFLAKEDGRVAGFVCGSLEPDRVQKTLLRKHFIKLPLLVGSRLLARPSLLRHILAMMKHMGAGEDPKPELLSIAVCRNSAAKGIGTKLLQSLIQFFEAQGVKHFKVIVDESLKANSFYIKRNFKLHARQEMLGKVMDVYIYTLQ